MASHDRFNARSVNDQAVSLLPDGVQPQRTNQVFSTLGPVPPNVLYSPLRRICWSRSSVSAR